MHARLPVQEHSAVFASLYVHILDISVLPPGKKRCQSESSLCIILLTLPICCCEVKILHLFELFMHFSEVRKNVAEPFCLSVHTLLSIINECTKVLFKHVLYFNFILEKLNWPMPHLALHELHNLSISSQKCILPPVVRENASQTPRPASGLQGQIFLPLLDFFLTPRKRALDDTQTRLSVHVHVHICHSPALFSTPALMIRIYLPDPSHCISPFVFLPWMPNLGPVMTEASWSWGFSPPVNINVQWATYSQIAKGNEGFMPSVVLHALIWSFIDLSKSSG